MNCAYCHKWMMAPKGAAFLYARREMQHLLEPLVVSWGWESERPARQAQGKPGPSCFVEYHEWQGTRDIAPFLAVPAAIRFFVRISVQGYNTPADVDVLPNALGALLPRA